MSLADSEVLIRVQPTPNPNAWKFILDRPVLNEGKATYSDLTEAEQNPLAKELFAIAGVKQVHFFQNAITITHTFDADPYEIQKLVTEAIQKQMPTHNPMQTREDEKALARKNLPEDVQKIEHILDRTIRPGLQGDGGDIEVVKLEGDQLFVHYEGACGTCPSATSGTLMAIEGILRDEFNPKLEVIPV